MIDMGVPAIIRHVELVIEPDDKGKCTRCGKLEDEMFIIIGESDVMCSNVTCDFINQVERVYQIGRKEPLIIPTGQEVVIKVQIKVKPLAVLCSKCVKEMLGDLLVLEEL